MDTTTLIAILTPILGILGAIATILGILYACSKDIVNGLRTMWKKEDIEGQTNRKEDIEEVWTSPMANEMKPKMNPPQSSSSLRNVSRDSLVEGRSLMTLLRDRLKFDPKNSVSIVSGHVDHFHSNKSEDAVLGWGCGLRSIQMLSSHLLRQRHETREVLYGGSGFVPDIASLQRCIELAWKKGFGRPTHDSDRGFSKNESRIGAKDCAALLRSFGLRANVVDFESTSSSFVQKGHLTEWVWNYFSDKKVNRSGDGRRVIVSEKAPLYFDHDGHSRTIVGIQATPDHSNGMQLFNLLIFDPHKETKSLEKCLINNVGWQQIIKRGSHRLKEPPYQLCYVDPGIACGEELENLKTITSIGPEF